MRKTLLATLAMVGAVAGGSAPQSAGESPAWRPVTHGLTGSVGGLLPAVISPAHPVRVISTALDGRGRPVVTAAAATDRAAAARLVAEGRKVPHAVGVELDAPVHAAGFDTLRSQQWDLDTMRVAGAWARATGAGVTVAVIDTGVDAGHPDLTGHVLPGADFITGTEGVATDPNGHGTHVAGTIAAIADNGVGIAGVAPEARILPVRVLGPNGSGYMSDVANGIVYAAEHGADVINMSVSSTQQLDAVTNAVAYARSRGVVVVAAAGNNRSNGSPTAYPAADPGVIAVAATDSADRVAAYSNQGSYVDVTAPGNDILSTFPPALGAEYRRMSGTSMASPHVAALAALLKSADRSLSPDAVERAIESSAADLGSPGRDDDFGYGRVDAAAALSAIAPVPPTAPASEPPTPESPGSQPATSAPADPQPTFSATEPEPEPSDRSPAPNQPDGTAIPSTPASPAPLPSTPEDVPPSPPPAPGGTPKSPVLAYAVRTGPQRLTAAIDGLDDQLVEVQRALGTGWETVRTYRATRVARIDGLPPGETYRIAVPASARFAAAVSNTVHF